MWQTLSQNAMLLAVGTYFLQSFKSTFINLFSYVMRNFTSYLETSTENDELEYERLEIYLINLRNKVIDNSKSIIRKMSYGIEWSEEFISPGVYYIYLKKFTWMIVSKNRIEKQNMYSSIYRTQVKFIGFNHKKAKAVVIEKLESNQSDVYSMSRKRHFVIDQTNDGLRDLLRKKTFNSLFIEDKKGVIEDIDNFINSKDYYLEKEINYKMGILLKGEPGTGKTSFAMALAKYLKWDLVLYSDSFRGQIREKSIILIEEVDCIGTNNRGPIKNNDSNENNNEFAESRNEVDIFNAGMGKSGLRKMLQLLDGVTTPSDVIFIMTTNHPEDLDPALFRHGRVTLDLTLGKISENLAEEMCEYYGISEEILDGEQFPINPSYLQNKILLNIDKLNYKNHHTKNKSVTHMPLGHITREISYEYMTDLNGKNKNIAGLIKAADELREFAKAQEA